MRFIDLGNSGKDISISYIDELEDIYKKFSEDNQFYRKLYETLDSEKALNKKLRIITEGHNIKYIEKAVHLFAPEIKESIFLCENIADKSGKDQLIQAYNVFSKTDAYPDTLFVWDSDAKDQIDNLVETSNTYKYVFDLNIQNTKIKKGIENLFAKSHFLKKYYTVNEVISDYGEVKKLESFDKKTFQKDILNKANKRIFKNMEPLVEKIKKIVNE